MQDAGTARNRRTKSGSLRAAREGAAPPQYAKKKDRRSGLSFLVQN